MSTVQVGIIAAVVAVVIVGVKILIFILRPTIEDMISDEIRSRLNDLPRYLIRLAVRPLPPKDRQSYFDELNLELTASLEGNERRQVTRLVQGLKFAAPLVVGAIPLRLAVVERKGRSAYRLIIAALCAAVLALGATVTLWRLAHLDSPAVAGPYNIVIARTGGFGVKVRSAPRTSDGTVIGLPEGVPVSASCKSIGGTVSDLDGHFNRTWLRVKAPDTVGFVSESFTSLEKGQLDKIPLC
jgi:hypothetical protein